jgi:hypothetical protein
MKALFSKCAMFLVLFAAPALADSVNTTISFTNQGNVSGDLATGAVITNVDTLTSTEGVIGPGAVGTLTIRTGAITGSVSTGGTFSAGVFNFSSKGATVFGGPLNGTWTKLANGQYQLAGQFSGVRSGVKYSGVTTQQFALTGGHYVAVSGTTTINATR